MASTMRNLARNESFPATVEKSKEKQEEYVVQEPVPPAEIPVPEAAVETVDSLVTPSVDETTTNEVATGPTMDVVQEVPAVDEKKPEKKSKPKPPSKKAEKVADQKKVKTPPPETDT